MLKMPIPTLALFGGMSLMNHANASEYGCTVLMCMSNPQGPMAVQQCIPPVQRLLEEQAQKPPKLFPTCEEGAPATMVPTRRNYDACPDGTRPLGESVKALQLSPSVFASMQQSTLTPRLPTGSSLPTADSLPTTLQTGIGDGEGQTIRQGQNKTCVANKLGDLAINFGTTDQPEVQKIPVYQQLSTIAPAKSPRVLDVFIDNKLYRSVRY